MITEKTLLYILKVARRAVPLSELTETLGPLDTLLPLLEDAGKVVIQNDWVSLARPVQPGLYRRVGTVEAIQVDDEVLQHGVRMSGVYKRDGELRTASGPVGRGFWLVRERGIPVVYTEAEFRATYEDASQG